MEHKELKEILIKVNLEKSDEALAIAEYSLSKNALYSALNRVYYAIFYTVTALAEKNDFKTSKHSALLGWFNKKFIYQERIFDENVYDVYNEAFKFRQKGDYDSSYIPDINVATDLFEKAKIVIKTIREHTQKDA